MRKVYQYLVIFSWKLYGQASTETIPKSWVIALDQMAREGKPCNSSSTSAHQLKEKVTKAPQSRGGMHAELYMFIDILDVIYAQ